MLLLEVCYSTIITFNLIFNIWSLDTLSGMGIAPMGALELVIVIMSVIFNSFHSRIVSKIVCPLS